MFETSFQAKFMIPMAVTLTFGLIFATLLTLVIVPALNLIFMDIRAKLTGHAAEDDFEDRIFLCGEREWIVCHVESHGIGQLHRISAPKHARPLLGFEQRQGIRWHGVEPGRIV